MKHIRTATGAIRRADLNGLFRLAYSLNSPPPVIVTAIGLTALTVMAVLDFVAGPSVGFGVFYTLAVMGVTFHAGWVAGAIMAILSSGAGLTARLFYLDDVVTAAALWNLANELAVFVAIVFVTHHGRLLLDQFASQTRRDLLTGAFNTRGVLEAFERERSRALRTSAPLTLAFIDLDNMKAVNDELGHAEGDEMLRVLASSVLTSIRETDVFGRVGGDEFALIMPDTDEHAAVKAIQRLRAVINRRTHDQHPYISVSVGVVTFRRDPPEAADALRAADSLMYVAKRAGGNRVAGRVLAWDSAPLSDFGLMFDIADTEPSWHVGDDGHGSMSA